MDRRDALRGIGLGTLAGAGGTHGFAAEADAEDVRGRVNTRSEPSQLRITDLRVVNAHNHWIVRLDTNQGLSGYGEVRDGASPTYALMLKSRVLGENPLHVDKVFRKLKQFGFHGRQAGGAVSIEMACWDLAGKAWACPAGRCWAASSATAFASTRTRRGPATPSRWGSGSKPAWSGASRSSRWT